MIRIGFDKQCITPAHPIALSGYAGKRISTGVHDDLYTRCIVMESEDSCYLIAQCDCLAVDETLRSLVLRKLSAFKIKEDHLILAATHTHSGPAGTIDTSIPPFSKLQDVFGAPNPAYMEMLADKIALAAANALADLSECKLTIGKGCIEDVGTERHHPSLPGDSSLLVLRFTRNDGKVILLYNYACHPTVMGPGNTLLTADFPYAVERNLPYDMVMFINGSAGDISTRFTRNSSSYEQIEAYSKLIIQGIESALASPIYDGYFDFADIRRYPVTLPVKKLPPKKVLEKKLSTYEKKLTDGQTMGLDSGNLRILASYVEGARVALELSEALDGMNDIETSFSIIKLQNLTIATIPGELFSTLGTRLKQHDTQVFGYSNGYYMYLADENAYENGYYEAMSSPFTRGTGEILVREILNARLLPENE